ncbi:MAG TPA: T3SS effector HopA1 family protein, partial [Chloroflexia bacterium]|nr:T3SS effector HopA1 family protein [Chloroflexia bacterium]
MARNLARDVTRNMMVSSLQSRLYRDYYSLGQATLRIGHAPDPYSKGATTYLQALSEANSGRGYWERGWQVVAAGENKVLAGKQGLHLVARPDEYRAIGTGVAPGAQVELLFPKELPSISPGYYMAVGDAEGSEDVGASGDGAEGLVRLYWHVSPDGAVELMRYATGILNEAALPFRLKVLNDPTSFTRCDAGILYVSKSHYGQVASLLGSIYQAIAPNVREGTPALTKRLAPGLGVAEDPEGGASFGLHRCNILAEGLVRAYERGARSLPDRLAVVEETFAEHGINLDAPYLNPGSDDDYMPLRDLPAPAAYIPLPQPDRDILLLTARQIGEGICADAVWHEGRCNWVGAQVAAPSGSGGHARLVYRTLGPDLYDGTAGVALFLAHLYAHTGDAQVYRTALGAARHALSCLARPSSRLGQGAYTGWPGTLLAAMRVGTLLDEPELLDEVARASRSLEPDPGKGHDLDLLSGSAGAIVAL